MWGFFSSEMFRAAGGALWKQTKAPSARVQAAITLVCTG
jgi:hypothetical protein